MFRHEGPSRSARKNAVLAAFLACVAGYVNSGGLLVIGSFTSHVTGSVGRLGSDLATGDVHAAVLAFALVLAFFLGAFAASVILEMPFQTRPNAYASALLAEGTLLAGFVLAVGLEPSHVARVLDLQAAILCVAMGMQNSMVTRLSGAVIRTTHLTGIITDLGIEAAHWYRWYFGSAASSGSQPAPRPARARTLLLLTITLAFTGGAVAGAALTLHLRVWAMTAPALAILGASAYAYVSARLPQTPSVRPPALTQPSGAPLAPVQQDEPRT